VSRATAVLTVAGALIVAAALAAAVFEGKPEGTSPVQGADPARLGSIDTNRYRYWDVALQTWVDHPIKGIGSGGFFTAWSEKPDREDQSRDAHSLYVETLAELGIVGFALLLALFGGVIACLVRLYRRAPGVATGLAAALFAFAIHAGLDWDWEMPALSMIALLLAGAVIAASEDLDGEDAEGSLETGAPRGLEGSQGVPVPTGAGRAG
jgi:O-antigen ligase